MNHQPFEEWLLADRVLTREEERDLQVHLRRCGSCGAIADSNLALHSTRQIQPPAGFTDRFKERLSEWRRQQLRRQILGTVVLVVGGLGLLYGVAGPVIQGAMRSPAGWIAAAAGYLVLLLTFFRVLSEIGVILVRNFSGFVPLAGWFLIFLLGCGLVLLWTTWMRRLARATQGVWK